MPYFYSPRTTFGSPREFAQSALHAGHCDIGSFGMPSLPNVLIRVRKLLADRLARTPNRSDNLNLNNAVWDLHNLMSSDMQMSNIYHQLSSSKRDAARYEDGVRRLAAWLESSPMTASTPGVRTAAAFYNQSVKQDGGSNGKDTVIDRQPTPAPEITPPAPRSAPMGQQNSMTVEHLSSGMFQLLYHESR